MPKSQQYLRELESSRAEKSRLKYALVASYRVAKAYQEAISVTRKEQEKRWLEKGLRKVNVRMKEYKRRLDCLQEVGQAMSRVRLDRRAEFQITCSRPTNTYAKTTVMTEPDVKRALSIGGPRSTR